MSSDKWCSGKSHCAYKTGWFDVRSGCYLSFQYLTSPATNLESGDITDDVNVFDVLFERCNQHYFVVTAIHAMKTYAFF